MAFDVHTYKHTTMGFEADVKAMPEAYEYSRSFFQPLLPAGERGAAGRRRRRPGGDAARWSRSTTAAGSRATCRRRSRPSRRRPASARPRSTYPGRTLPILDIAYKGDAFDPANRDYVAARLLGDLAFGETSELYKKLVLDEQKVEIARGRASR